MSEITSVHWISLALTLLGVIVTGAVTYGAVLTRIKVLEERVKILDKGREGQGARIGVVEERVSNLEGRSGIRHRHARKPLDSNEETHSDG